MPAAYVQAAKYGGGSGEVDCLGKWDGMCTCHNTLANGDAREGVAVASLCLAWFRVVAAVMRAGLEIPVVSGRRMDLLGNDKADRPPNRQRSQVRWSHVVSRVWCEHACRCADVQTCRSAGGQLEGPLVVEGRVVFPHGCRGSVGWRPVTMPIPATVLCSPD